MSTVTFPAAERRLLSREADRLIDRWEVDISVMLDAVQAQTLLTLADLESAFSQRRFGYGAEATRQIAAYAADVAGTTLDLLGNLHGAFLKEADEAGIVADLFAFDDAELRAEFAKWEEREKARGRNMLRAAEWAMKIVTIHDYPPIPVRCFDWCAHLDGYDSAPDSGIVGNWLGHGETKEAAIADLLLQIGDWLADLLDDEQCHD